MSLLEQNNSRKKWVDKKVLDLNFDAGNSKKYQVKPFWNNVIYIKKAESSFRSLLFDSVAKLF